MRILVASRSDGAGGGAGRVADDLAAGLAGAGHRVTRAVRRLPAAGRRPRPWFLPGPPGDVLLRNAIGIDPSGAALVALSGLQRPDIVHMHDPVVAFGHRAAQAISRRHALVVTLHDFSAFTGGCLFPGDCGRYETRCGSCPQLGRWPLLLPVDLTRRTWAANARLARSPRVAYVAPSRHVARMAHRGALSETNVSVIPNPVDTTVFAPDRRTASRRESGFADRDRVILFVAFDIADPRKGFADLALAFAHLAAADKHARLLVVGRAVALPEALRPFADRVVLRGSIADPAELAAAYAASDVLAVPSCRDNTPCTIAESLACGTPVVAYDTGGISEMFVDAEHGRLVRKRSSGALEAAIAEALGPWAGDAVRARCRRFAEQRYALSAFIAAHEQLYARLLKR